MKKQKGLIRAGHYDFEDYKKNKTPRTSARWMKKQYLKRERRAWAAEIRSICHGVNTAFPENENTHTCPVSIPPIVWEGDFYFILNE